MELGKHCENSRTLLRGVVLKMPSRSTVHKRKQGDGVARPNSTHRFAVAREDRREHEVEAGVAEGNGAAECTDQAVEHRLPSISEPGLPFEVVDSDEAARPRSISCPPMVAPKPDRCVVDRIDI